MKEINFVSEIQEKLRGFDFLEQTAQKFIDEIYERLEETIVQARFFATVPFGKLPDANQAFVQKLAQSNNVADLVDDLTLVLSLLGTRGENKDWNSRHNSEGHVGIPLVSSAFIDEIPMMSRLLKELGLGLEWIDSKDSNIVGETMGKMSGLFYVRDAATEVDQRGRKIIAAQDFVERYHVKTVFGLGGGYLIGKMFITTIIFTRETIDKDHITSFLPLLNAFKMSTTSLVSQGKIFG